MDSYYSIQAANVLLQSVCASLTDSSTSTPASVGNSMASSVPSLIMPVNGTFSLNMSTLTSQAGTEPTIPSKSTAPAENGARECTIEESTGQGKEVLSTPQGLSEYNQARLVQIEANHRIMEELGLDKLAQGIWQKKTCSHAQLKKPVEAPMQGPTWMMCSQAPSSSTAMILSPLDPVLPPPTTLNAVPTLANDSMLSGCAREDSSVSGLTLRLAVEASDMGATLGMSTLQATLFTSVPTPSALATMSEATVLVSATSAVILLNSSKSNTHLPTAVTSNTTLPLLASSRSLLQPTSSTSFPILKLTTLSSCAFVSDLTSKSLVLVTLAHGLAADTLLLCIATAEVHSMVPFTIINNDTPKYIADALEFFSFIKGGGDSFCELVELWQVF